MTMKFSCPSCQTTLAVRESNEARQVRCPKCAKLILVKPSGTTEKRSSTQRAAASNVGSRQSSGSRPSRTRRDYDEVPGRSRRKQNTPLFLAIGVGGLLFVIGAAFVVVMNPPSDRVAAVATVAERETLTSAAEESTSAPVNAPVSAAPATSTPPKPTPAPSVIRSNVDLATLVDQVDDAIVLITTQDSSGTNVSLGSGFVIDPAGLVATNYHVIQDSTGASALFRDGKQRAIVGCRAFDKDADLAILEVKQEGGPLPSLPMAADSDPLPGTSVVAMGNPSGFKFAVTSGIISAVHKTSELPPAYQQFVSGKPDQVWLQTSAAISAGNSGGPLLLETGEVVGINTWVAAGQNLGFASHIKHLRELKEKLEPKAIALKDMNKATDELDFIKELDPQLVRLFEEYARAAASLPDQIQSATTPDQVLKILEGTFDKYLREIAGIADRNPKTPLALQAYFLTYKIASTSETESAKKFAEKSRDAILRDHLEDPNLFAAVFLLMGDSSRQSADFLKQIATRTSQRPAQGGASFVAARVLSRQEIRRRRWLPETMSLLDKVSQEFADIPLQGTTLGQMAEDLRFRIEHLSVGCPAPELVAQDTAGNEIRLADLRGKVVVLDFFTDWCPYCRRMYPDERQFCSEFQSRPFALVGINCENPERVKQLIGDKTITWPCIADGVNGPIAKRWGVSSYPTVYVFDAKGILRHRFSGDPGTALRTTVVELMDEAEGKKSSEPTVDLDARLAELKKSLVAEPTITVLGKAMELLHANRSHVKPSHIRIVDGWMKTVIKEDPKAAYIPYFRAQLAELNDQVPMAVKFYREALKRPELPPIVRAGVQNSLAYLLALQRKKSSDLEEADTLIEHAVRTLGKVPAIIDTQAMVYLSTGKKEEAHNLLEVAYAEDPKPIYLFHLACAELSMGDKEAAKLTMAEAKDAGFDPKELCELEQTIHEELLEKVK